MYSVCPICIANKEKNCFEQKGSKSWGFSTHIFEGHGPEIRHLKPRYSNETYSFSLVVCRHPNGKYLIVQEGCQSGW
jgi:hypothetical protein